MNLAVYIDNPWISFFLAFVLLFFGFIIIRFGIRVFGLILGGFFGFIGVQVVEVWTGVYVSPWVYVVAAGAGGIGGMFVFPAFTKAGVMFFSFLFGLFLPDVLGWLGDLLSFPGHPMISIAIRLGLGVIFLVLAYQLFLQIIVILSALMGASLMTDLIGGPGLFFPLLIFGLLVQFFILRRFPAAGRRKPPMKKQVKE